MRKTPIVIMMLSLAATAPGCAGRRGPSPLGDPALPRVGWVIMHGDKENPDQEFGCQSNPRTECAIDASTPDRQTFSEVHLYFHPTKTDTTYSGVVHVGFFNAAETSPGVKPRATVKPGIVGNHSVIGIVTDRPGRYMFTVDITAAIHGGGEQHIREEVPVVVNRPGERTVAAARTGGVHDPAISLRLLNRP